MPPARPMYARAMPPGGGATTIEAGEGTVTVALQVTYALQQTPPPTP